MQQSMINFDWIEEHDDFETVMPDDFETVMPKSGKRTREPKASELIPRITYNNVDGYISMNTMCVKLIGTTYALFKQGKSNKELVMIKGCDTKKPGAHILLSGKSNTSGRMWRYVEVAEIFENCETVRKADRNAHETFYFYGVYDEVRNAVAFDLRYGIPNGKVKRREKKREAPEQAKP